MTAPLSLSLYCSALNLTPMTRELTDKKMRDEVAQSEVICIRLVDLPATAKREARTATLEVRAQRMVIKPPSSRKHLPEVTLSVVWVREAPPIMMERSPFGLVGVNRQVRNSHRRGQKNGPGDDTDLDWLLLNSLPIKSKDDVLRIIDLYVARWRIMSMTFLGRECPELPCDVIFGEAEWKSVWKIVEHEDPAEEAPTLEVFIPVLAQLELLISE